MARTDAPMNLQKTTLIAALMLATFLAAVEVTVVTLAIPTIVKDLQGLELISMVFSAYLLTSAISTPIYGKLSDLYGRKITFSIGVMIFLLGSFLCGLSQSMHMLISFRALQGLGAGAIYTVSYTIIGDVFPIEERSKIQGGLSSVWGIAGVVGPFLGGFLIDVLSWHWIFFINIPFGLLSVFLLQKSMKEKTEKKKHTIDFAGAIILSLAMAVFMQIFLSRDTIDINRYAFTVISVIITVVLLGVFYRIEKKAPEPIIPFDVFTKTNIWVNIIAFLVSSILVGCDVYMPIYLQTVLGYSPTASGLILVSMSVSWLIVSFILGKYIVRYGGKSMTFASCVVLLLSSLLLPTLGIKSGLLTILIYIFVIGIAFGGIYTTSIIIIQDSVIYNKRGAAVATITLVRSLGQMVGISIFGSFFNLYITKYFIDLGIRGVDPSNLYQAAQISSQQVSLSLNSAIHMIFIIFIVISILALAASAIMPKISGEQAGGAGANPLSENGTTDY